MRLRLESNSSFIMIILYAFDLAEVSYLKLKKLIEALSQEAFGIIISFFIESEANNKQALMSSLIK